MNEKCTRHPGRDAIAALEIRSLDNVFIVQKRRYACEQCAVGFGLHADSIATFKRIAERQKIEAQS